MLSGPMAYHRYKYRIFNTHTLTLTYILQVHMLSGAILPVWSSLQAAIRDVGGSK